MRGVCCSVSVWEGVSVWKDVSVWGGVSVHAGVLACVWVFKRGKRCTDMRTSSSSLSS